MTPLFGKFIRVRKFVFWPPVLLLLSVVLFSTLIPNAFLGFFRDLQTLILIVFSQPISYLSLLMTVLACWVMFSPLGSYRIGGKDATPRLSFLAWFAIVLCTTIAVGILFWGSAEPLSHFLFPPDFFDIVPESQEAKRFAIGALFFHWGITPYSIYAVPALLFALLYYSGKNKFRLSILLRPLGLKSNNSALATGIDVVSLFSLVAGMAGSLGAGVLSLASAVSGFFPEIPYAILTLSVTAFIVFVFVLSASTGIDRGIRKLSLLNLWFFLVFAGLFIWASWAYHPFSKIQEGFADYIRLFPDLSLQLSGKGNSWTHDWSTFNFAIWMAWAPITALFLGKIAIGRTVRQFLLVNLLLPASFCLIWMGIFGGVTLDLASQNGVAFREAFGNLGPESIIYQVFDSLGYLEGFSIFFGIGMFLSYVTAADSSTEAMASLSTKGKLEDEFHVDTKLKIFWGILLGVISWIMISFSGIEGVRMISTIGGAPAFVLLIFASISLLKISLFPRRHLHH